MDEQQQAAAAAEAPAEGASSEAPEGVESLPQEVAQEVAVGLIAALRALPDCDSFTVAAQEDGSMLVECMSGDKRTPYAISADDVSAAQMMLDGESEDDSAGEEMPAEE